MCVQQKSYCYQANLCDYGTDPNQLCFLLILIKVFEKVLQTNENNQNQPLQTGLFQTAKLLSINIFDQKYRTNSIGCHSVIRFACASRPDRSYEIVVKRCYLTNICSYECITIDIYTIGHIVYRVITGGGSPPPSDTSPFGAKVTLRVTLYYVYSKFSTFDLYNRSK